MRVLIFVLVLVAFVCICEARKHKRRDNLFGGGKKVHGVEAPSANPFHKGRKYRSGPLRGQHLFSGKNSKVGKHDKWMRYPIKKSECKTTKCGQKEFCIVHPTQGVEKCISKQDFREGRRLFKQFHKQKKALKNEDQIKQLEAELVKGEHIKDIFELMNHHVKSRNENHRRWKKEHHKNMEKKQDKMFKEAMNEQECRSTEISELKKRMIGWFDVIHTESRQDHHRMRQQLDDNKVGKPFFKHMKGVKTLREHHDKSHKKEQHHRAQRSVHDVIEKESHGGCMCSKSVMWEFRKQDMSNDGHLTEKEMVVMESNRREPCMKPLLKSCDSSEADGKLTRGEWCCCFQNTVAPCLEKQKRTNQAVDWVPRCDSEGYFEREQCHKSGYCWCVDMNGNTIENTKTKGKVNCGMYGPSGYLIKQ